MSMEQDSRALFVEQKEAIKRRIVQRTGGRIETLEVELIDDSLVIRGIVPCYYVKQLVLQAVLDLIGSVSDPSVEFNVQVLCNVRNPTDTQ